MLKKFDHKNAILKLYFLIFILSLFSCADDKSTNPDANGVSTKIAVITDLHYYDQSLGTDGEEYTKASVGSGKMLAESKAILTSVFDMIVAENVDIVLITGDLTHDGEKVCHEELAILLKQLTDKGIKVIVSPGNHDINNQSTYRYSGNEKFRVPNINSNEFLQIYQNFGFSDAIYKDNNSLTYIAEPVEGLWVFAMDDNRYKEITNENIVGGKFSTETFDWIKSKITEGRSKGKLMIGMNHHGILEHFAGQKSNPITADFVIDDYQNVSEQFAELGLRFVFTGHFHANDIVVKKTANSYIYDIESGATTSYPVPIRFVTINKSETMEIQTKRITNINYDTKGLDFQSYTKQIASSFFNMVFINTLSNDGTIDSADVSQIAPLGAQAYMAHYLGDEVIPAEAIAVFNKYQYTSNSRIATYMSYIKSVFTDLPPADNNIKINITTGNVIQ